MTSRDRPVLTATELAETLWCALKEHDEDAFLHGTWEGRCTLIDGNFDLISVAEDVLVRLEAKRSDQI